MARSSVIGRVIKSINDVSSCSSRIKVILDTNDAKIDVINFDEKDNPINIHEEFDDTGNDDDADIFGIAND